MPDLHRLSEEDTGGETRTHTHTYTNRDTSEKIRILWKKVSIFCIECIELNIFFTFSETLNFYTLIIFKPSLSKL